MPTKTLQENHITKYTVLKQNGTKKLSSKFQMLLTKKKRTAQWLNQDDLKLDPH